MDSFHNPVGPKDPYKGYRVDELEEKHAREEKASTEDKTLSESTLLGAYFLSLFRKFCQLFQEESERGLSTEAEKEVRADLLLFKEALEILKKEDRSQDTQFLNHLSELWHQVLEDSLRFKRKSSFSSSFRAMIQEIQHYPPNQEHTLGYYLTEYAGQDWLPFPYMDLIQKMHQQHEANPRLSPLTQWTDRIDRLTSILSHTH